VARVHVFISGKVQGVYFRDYTRREAEKLGIVGWVRNLPDGRVEAVFEGQEEQLQKMLSWCRQGSPRSIVDEVEVIRETREENFKDFRITG